MILDGVVIFLGLILSAGAGYLVAWLIHRESMERSATYASSLEQVLAGTMRERDAALDRERLRKLEVNKAEEAHKARVLELEKELEHRETQVIAFRDEAMHLARAREEVAQRLTRQEQQAQEIEASLKARIEELQETGGTRGPGNRATGAEREVAALVAAHETDLAELESRYLMLIRSKDAEIERLLALRASQAVSIPEAATSEPVVAPSEVPPVAAAPDPVDDPDPAPSPAAGHGSARPAESSTPRSRRNRRRSKDDLKQITGIDDSLEQALHLVGITSFKQVARWKDKDIEKMAKKLYQPVERIRDEQWVEKAREAYSRKYGGSV
jgi:predicted flap endonuclease-1-like 5' DNA nuclease